MTPEEVPRRHRKLVERLVAHYVQSRNIIDGWQGAIGSQLRSMSAIVDNTHMISTRVKDPAHLRGKLVRKIHASSESGRTFDITPDNLFSKVTDLIGFRLVHLSRHQMPLIHGGISQLIKDFGYKRLECFARTWDDESREFYRDLKIKVETSSTMYTSVHYVIRSTSGTPSLTAEIQVRTLAEELWGEVDHVLNYPVPSTSKGCRQQLRVLARLVSTCTRLVDSIYDTVAEERDDSQ